MATQYRFKTIMVTDNARLGFTSLRNRLAKKAGKRITDKELFDAIYNQINVKELSESLLVSAKAELEAREVNKLKALQAKLEAKLAKVNESAEIDEVEAGEEVEVGDEIAA